MFKRILKYGLYFFAGLWMFALGVMVGRGTSPVSFDTRDFQTRLGAIAREYTNQEKTEQKVDFRFYDALNNPVPHEVMGRAKKSGEILPRPEPSQVFEKKVDTGSRDVPVKLSKKYESLNRELLAEFKKKAEVPKAEVPKSVPEPVPVFKAGNPVQIVSKEKKPLKEKAKAKVKISIPAYTIQVAAYRAFKDAISQMAALEKKGIDAYRVKGTKDGATWYRVRTGAFPDYKAALARLEQLKQAKVNGMIIKKE